MLVPHTPPPSQHPLHESTALSTDPTTHQQPHHHASFFSLPLELREEIFTYALHNISPATYIIYRHAAALNWSFRRIQRAATPAILLVSKAMRRDVEQFLNRTTTGPRLRIGPGRRGLSEWMPREAGLYDKADERDCVFGLAGLLSSAGKLDVGVNVSSDLAEQGRVLALLRWVVAVVNARDEVPWSIRVEMTLERVGLRPCEKGSLWQVLDGLSCRDLEVVCLCRKDADEWVKERLEALSGERAGDAGASEEAMEQKEMDVAVARQGVLDSRRRRYGRASRDQPALWDLGRWPSVSKFW